MRGNHTKLGEGGKKVRLGQDSLPNKAVSAAETSGNWPKSTLVYPNPQIDFLVKVSANSATCHLP